MRAMPLQLLTWGTAAAAISSALWLSSAPDSILVCSLGYDAASRALDLDTLMRESAPSTWPGPASVASGSGSS